MYGDSRVVIGAATKGRSSSWRLNTVLRRCAAFQLAFDLILWQRHVPSAQNPADGPSRGQPLPPAGARHGPLSLRPHALAVPPGLEFTPTFNRDGLQVEVQVQELPRGNNRRRLRPVARKRSPPRRSPLLPGSNALRRHLEKHFDAYGAIWRESKRLRKQLRQAEKRNAAMARAGLCWCPALGEHIVKELRRALGLAVARRNLFEERWLNRRLDMWGVPDIPFEHFAGLSSC